MKNNRVNKIPLAPIREDLQKARIRCGIEQVNMRINHSIDVQYIEDQKKIRKNITINLLLKLCKIYYPENPVDHAFQLRDKALGIKEEE